MTVSLIQEQENRSSSHNIKNERTYSRTWLVETDTATDDAVTVENAWVSSTGIVAGVAHPNDSGAVAKEISTSCDSEDGKSWTVSCSYGLWDEDDTNPLNQPADVQYSFNTFEKIVERDQQNNAIVNSAQDPFSDPVNIDDSRLVVTITQNQASFNVSMAAAYVNAVNSDAYLGCAPRQWKCASIGATKEYDAEYGAYYKCTATLEFRVEKYDIKILDQGTRELDGGVKKNILVGGAPVTDPVLLDGNGGKLDVAATPQYRTFRCYPELPFSGVF